MNRAFLTAAALVVGNGLFLLAVGWPVERMGQAVQTTLLWLILFHVMDHR